MVIRLLLAWVAFGLFPLIFLALVDLLRLMIRQIGRIHQRLFRTQPSLGDSGEAAPATRPAAEGPADEDLAV